MASSSGVQQSFQQQFKCKECGLALNSAESLEVHRQYHEGNLMQQWAVKAHISNSEEKNNNMTKQQGIKREFPSSNSVQGESSDTQKKSPDYQRTTPEGMYGPPTPQSYHSSSSPYQQNDNSAFAPNFQNFPVAKSEGGSFPVVKSEGGSPVAQHQSHYQNFSNFSEQHPPFFNLDHNITFSTQDIHGNKVADTSCYRYQPYIRNQYYESKPIVVPTPHASPVYPPQPTPSPSPKQCDKCGYVCESAAQLIEHNNMTHSNNVQIPHQYGQGNHFMFNSQISMKEEEASQSEILDLDSHKVVHPDWVEKTEESDKRPNGEPGIPHSVSTMLNTWPPQPQQPNNMFQGEHNIYLSDSDNQKSFPNLSSMQGNKMFSNDQKMFHPIDNQNYMNNVVSSSNSEMGAVNQQHSYRAFEHLQQTAPSSVITSTPQVPAGNPPAAPTSTKSANWKSNEARRPKTYNCTACNKWFTSSGHLKRHYNTTLHKNAVKSSGQPDPATMPISAHHHPAREATSSKDDRQNSSSPREDSRGEDSNGMASQYDNRLSSMPGLLQHPPNGPYDRQGMHPAPPMHSPLGQHHTPLANPSPLGGHIIQNPGFSSLSNGSPPNGDAGLSPPDPRGLLSMPPSTHSFNMMPQPHMMPMEATQFQMYPNESAPRVTQATDTTNNLNTIGEQQMQYVVQMENQPLPSFSQIQAHRFGGGYANVGGLGSVTAPASFTFFPNEEFDLNDASRTYFLRQDVSEISGVTPDNSVIEQQSVHDVSQMSHFSSTSSSSNNDVIQINSQFSPASNSNNNDVLQISQFSPNNNSNNSDIIQMSQFSPNTSNNNGPIQMTQFSPASSGDVTFTEMSNVTNLTYLSPGPSQSQDLAQSPGVPTDPQDESKENYEVNATGSPSVSSTVVNQEDLSKTKCFDCDKVFNRPCYLTQHNKTCHNGDKPFKCSRCGKRFSNEETYKEHTSKHAGDKPHKCDMCPKMFNHKTDLRRHLCCHTGKKPFACSICKKGFIRKDHMVKHMDTHLRKREKLSAMRH